MVQQKPGWRAVKFTARQTEKAVVGMARWATTDHAGTGRMLASMPAGMGFVEAVNYIIVQFLIAMVGVAVSGLLFYLMFAYGVPLLFGL